MSGRTSWSRPTGTSSSRSTCSRPACRSTCATGRLGGGVRDRAVRRGRRARLPQAAHARVRGLDGVALPPDERRRPTGDPELILEDMDLDGVDAQVMHPNLLAVRALHRRPRAVDRARPRLQRLRHRAVHAVLRPPRADRADPAHRHRRRRRRDRARRGRRVPGDAAAGDAADAVLLARVRPGVGRGAGERRARVRPHPDRRRQGRRPEAPTLKVVMENGRRRSTSR